MNICPLIDAGYPTRTASALALFLQDNCFILIFLQYEKLTLNDDGEIIRSEFVVEGRKQPLTVVRENFLRSHASYMRNIGNEELTKMSREEIIEKLVQVNAVFSAQMIKRCYKES